MLRCEYRNLGRLDYGAAAELQRELVEKRKLGLIPDQLLILEHDHVITLGRSGKQDHLLASEEVLRRAGVAFFHSDRGGDITYHGPGQVIGYPILDLREWKRDVTAYVRAIEQALIDMLAEFGISGGRVHGCTGVWVDDCKVAAIGVHISRWVTSHGFALNVMTDLNCFGYIVPCGLTKPVTSMAALGCKAGWGEVAASVVRNFGRVFEREMVSASH
jgi:lipoyl(octanoyl) transferase